MHAIGSNTAAIYGFVFEDSPDDILAACMGLNAYKSSVSEPAYSI